MATSFYIMVSAVSEIEVKVHVWVKIGALHIDLGYFPAGNIVREINRVLSLLVHNLVKEFEKAEPLAVQDTRKCMARSSFA